MYQSKYIDSIKQYIWPFNKKESEFIAPMTVLFFLIALVYNITKALKKSMIIQLAGQTCIPAIKIYLVSPIIILFIWLLNFLHSFKSKTYTISFFLNLFTYFFISFLIILCYQENFVLTSLSNYMQNIGFKQLALIIKYWYASLFYVMAELWSTIILVILFWGLANDITPLKDAKRYYAFFALSSNIATFVSGSIGQILQIKEHSSYIPYGSNAWEQTALIQLIALITAVILIKYLFVNLTKYLDINFSHVTKKPIKKKKISIKTSFKLMLSNKYITNIVLMVFCYFVTYNLADTLMDAMLDAYYPKNMINKAIHLTTSITGIAAIIFSIICGSTIFQKISWLSTAIISPAIWLIIYIIFLASYYDIQNINIYLPSCHFCQQLVPVFLMIIIMQIVFSRAAKYTFYDVTKEMAFIPLSSEEKNQAKSIIDGIGSKFGKLTGSIITYLLITFFDSILASESIKYLMLFTMISLIVWFISIYNISMIMKVKTSANNLHAKEDLTQKIQIT